MRGPSPRSYEVTRSVRSTSTAAPPRWSRCRSSSSASSPQAIRHSFNEATALPPSIAGVIIEFESRDRVQIRRVLLAFNGRPGW